MKITLFSAEQATNMARELTPELERLVRLRRYAARIERQLEVMSLALAGASADNPDASEMRTLVERRQELAAQARDGLRLIHDRGCIVKDLDRGLIDFYALAGDRLVFLCWQLGEKEVSHWHTLAGGFSTRQPLDKSPLE
jgi:hypothetical protein